MTTITQQDREVAARYCEAGGWPTVAMGMRNCERDHDPEVLVAAASRIETEKKIVEWLRTQGQELEDVDRIAAIEAGGYREQQS